MKSPWSRTIVIAYPGGSVERTSSIRSFTAWMTWTALVPDWRRMLSTTAGEPFTLARVAASAMPSSMVATSATVIACPSRTRTTISPNCSTDCTRPRVRTVRFCGPCSSRPPGTSTFCDCSARDTSVTVTL